MAHFEDIANAAADAAELVKQKQALMMALSFVPPRDLERALCGVASLVAVEDKIQALDPEYQRVVDEKILKETLKEAEVRLQHATEHLDSLKKHPMVVK